jgi:hypothetical protein
MEKLHQDTANVTSDEREELGAEELQAAHGGLSLGLIPDLKLTPVRSLGPGGLNFSTFSYTVLPQFQFLK